MAKLVNLDGSPKASKLGEPGEQDGAFLEAHNHRHDSRVLRTLCLHTALSRQLKKELIGRIVGESLRSHNIEKGSIMAEKTQRPKGSALRWTPEQIAALAVIRESDIVEARAAWRRHAPAKMKKLLDARRQAR